MPTSSEVVAKRRREEAWESYMAGLRAAEAARQAQPAPEPEPPVAPEPAPEESSDG